MKRSPHEVKQIVAQPENVVIRQLRDHPVKPIHFADMNPSVADRCLDDDATRRKAALHHAAADPAFAKRPVRPMEIRDRRKPVFRPAGFIFPAWLECIELLHRRKRRHTGALGLVESRPNEKARALRNGFKIKLRPALLERR